MGPFTDYLKLTRSDGLFLFFGFMMAFTSSAGQTYFIGIFGPEIRQTFDLSHSQWGTIYLIGTLCSALVLPWSGQLLDRVHLPLYTLIVMTGLVLACLTISFSSSIVFLIIAIFLLRQFGQGLVSHTALTSMARYINPGRGKAIAIATMGFSTGEACLPLLAVIMIGSFGWRTSYQLTAMIVLFFIPLAIFSLRHHSQRHRKYTALQNDQTLNSGGVASKTRRQMLRDSRFYLLLPAILAPSMILTALFFHHLTLAEAKGWSGIWITANYWVYALCTVITSLATGPLIDRFTATRIIPYYLLPLIIGLLILYPVQSKFWVIPYMILIGINTGFYFTVVTALWAELYGTRHLGEIKSLVGAFGVFASALGPVSIGLLLDLNFKFETTLLAFVLLCAVSTVLMVIGIKRYQH